MNPRTSESRRDLRPVPGLDLSTVADHIVEALSQVEAELRLEQSVHGLDALSEVALHELLTGRLATHYQVAREVCYPSSTGAKRSHRQRCDLVLSSKGQPLLPEGQLGLSFGGDGATTSWSPPEEALWLEVKRAHQFREGGLWHRGYGGQFRQGVVKDLRKMAAEASIREGGLLLIAFNESVEVLTKDLLLFESLLEQAELLCGFRQERRIPIQERIGHTLCTAVLWPMVGAG